MTTVPVFDGHNDVLTRILKSGGVAEAKAFLTGLPGHVDAPKAKAGGFAGGFFAIWVPSPAELGDVVAMMQAPSYDLPLPPAIDQPDALGSVMAEAAILMRLEALGALTICTTVAEIEACITNGTMAAILHLEGAEAIDPDFHALDVLYRAGLRSLGPVWSRPTIFAEGVPFRFPATPDIGPGLTDHGRRLVARCNALGVMLDLSHLNDAGFRDVAHLSEAPLVATHSNAHAICPHARNLTDCQLSIIGESGGMVGLNFAVAFLREDGGMYGDTPVEVMLRHIDHMIGIMGEDCVGLGSDYDGATTPDRIGGVDGLPVLIEAMRAHGYGETLIEKLAWRNWMRVLRATWR
ncbi:MAG: dipeptidase [Pseudomonadota bacterium]